jgi:AraC-like DNA-binding protein
MDPLSDVLRAVKLNGAYFYRVEAAAPWSVSTMAARDLVPRILPEAEHLISYHILLSGICWGGVEGEPQVRMQPGDVIVFPHGDPHLMSGAEGHRVDAGRDGASPPRYPGTVFLGPDAGRDTTFVCGFLGCDVRPYNPLLASLPRRIHVPAAASGWLAHFPQQVVAESRMRRVGGETMLTRMAELMFVEVVRRYVEQLPPQHTGWLAGLMDAVVGPALSKLHERPAHPWTLAELARTIASSRTVLAERFSQIVGVPPMLYLTRWRLQLAAEQLSRGSAKVAAIGAQVGYESEAAFSRAFKRETGLSPSAWRRARDGGSLPISSSPH